MSFASGVYTPPNGAEDAIAGGLIRSGTWNSINTDMSGALTSIGEGLKLEYLLLDNPQQVLTAGVKGYLEVPLNCTILSWALLADRSGSIVVDIWKVPFASFPPNSGNSITASARPTITSAQAAASSVLTGWTTAITSGDILAFNVVSCSTIRQATLSLSCGRTQ